MMECYQRVQKLSHGPFGPLNLVPMYVAEDC